MYITASKLYDYIQCSHRVWRDLYGPQEEKDPQPNAFLQLLWERGVKHEKDVIKGIGSLLDLSNKNKEIQLVKTLQAIKDGIPLIYHGYIRHGNLAGEPDLLRRNNDGTYIAIDIKSGRGVEGATDDDDEPKKPKKHYSAQLGLYAEILILLGYAKEQTGIILDIDNNEVLYDLTADMGVKTKRSWWSFYQEIKNETELLLTNKRQDRPALTGTCKLCPWYKSCKKWCEKQNDLTTLFYIGRSYRNTIVEDLHIETVDDLCSIDIPNLLEKKSDKTFLKDIGKSRLEDYKRRAIVKTHLKKPVLLEPITFPKVRHELYFDIEDDPTQGFVYLHGVYERINGVGQPFHAFVAKEFTRDAEKNAWIEFLTFVRSLQVDNYCLYYYSHHEHSTYKRMQKQYPDVISELEIEELFNEKHAVDLYTKIIANKTEWPLYSYSLKEIAHYLDFNWRDKTPSGALSIQWFNEYLETKDTKKLERIILYNEDDCKATMVIKDYLEQMMPTSISL